MTTGSVRADGRISVHQQRRIAASYSLPQVTIDGGFLLRVGYLSEKLEIG